MSKDIRFGIQQPSFTFPRRRDIYKTAESIALRAEKLGFDSFWTMDHFIQIPSIGGAEKPMMEAWMTLAAIASKTRRIRLGTLCTSNAYRDPPLLAKMGATLDVVSKGRLIMGVGGGWYQREFDAYGIPFYTVGQRLRRLEEAIQIINRMWMEEVPSFQGRYYTIQNAICNPKPVQKPRPPILIGGGGEKVTLKLVAKYADMSNLFGDAPTVRHKLEVLEKHCADVGRDSSEIVKSRLGTIVLARSEAELLRKLELLCPTGTSPGEYRQRVMAGTPSQCVQACGELVEAGAEYLIFNFPDAYDPETLQLFAEEIMPAFK